MKNKIERLLQKWQKQKEMIETKYKIDNEKRQLRKKYKEESTKTTTSKLLIAFLFINCTAIEIFTAIITLKSFSLAAQIEMAPDLTPLITLIGTVVSEVIGFAIYAVKSTKENTQGGIIYDLAMQKNNNCSTEEDEEVEYLEEEDLDEEDE